jgi:predicted MFS family arabinose efflux permease
MGAQSRTLALYPVYQAARNALFWLPVFFLYLSSACTVAEVLVLEAIYYAGVVVLEVPSGYLSDRVGRKPTLVAAMVAVTAAHAVFATTHDFVAFAGAQLLLAAGMAFNSGTDGALLYDTLAARGEADSYGDREGKAQSLGLISMSLASAIGGVLAGVDLRLAYVLSGVAAAVGLVVALGFEEPSDGDRHARPPIEQLRAVWSSFGSPKLTWVFAFVVAMTVFNHVPYELVQPYLALLLGRGEEGLDPTPMAAGMIAAVGMLISAYASRRSADLARAWGPARTWIAMLALQAAIIGALGVAVHPLVAVVLLLRGVPGAVMRPTVGAMVHPLLDAGVRATYMSFQSLAGRLAFSLSLLGASALVGDLAILGVAGMTLLSRVFAGAAVVVGVALAATARVLRRADEGKPDTD